MTIIVFKVLYCGTVALIAAGLPALEAFLNRKYPLTPEQEERRRSAIMASRRAAA